MLYIESVPIFTIVKFLVAEFKLGHTSLNEHSGRPKTGTTCDNVENVHQMDHRIKKRQQGLSKECICHFGSKTHSNKHFQTSFGHRFITVDETWIHHYTPETKKQSKRWVANGKPAQKKAKIISSAAEKGMAIVFCDSREI